MGRQCSFRRPVFVKTTGACTPSVLGHAIDLALAAFTSVCRPVAGLLGLSSRHQELRMNERRYLLFRNLIDGTNDSVLGSVQPLAKAVKVPVISRVSCVMRR